MTDPLALIREELCWPFRYPKTPEITEDTLFGDWFGPIDRICVQCRLEEEFGIEIACAEAETWLSVRDVLATVGRLTEQGVAA